MATFVSLLGFGALCFVVPRLAPGFVGRLWALVLWLGRHDAGG